MPGIAEELFIESDKLPIRLYCSICLDVAEEAIITACDHLFCKVCIEQLQKANGQNCECPNCRKDILPITPATSARNYVSQQIVYCSEYEQFRCGWTGKYSMWHTHKAKYCKRATREDKLQAKNKPVSEIGQYSEEELSLMGVSRLKKILQEYLKLNIDNITEQELNVNYNYKQFLEKKEYINAILKFEANYGVSAKYSNKSPSKSNDEHKEQQDHDQTHKNSNSEFPTTYDGLKKLKIRELSGYLKSKNIDPRSPEYNCVEKSDLINLVLKTQQHFANILNGNAYDPTMERQKYNASPQPIFPCESVPLNDEHEFKQGYDEQQQQQQQQASSTAYQYGIDQLRRSSINRVDLNQNQNNQNYQPVPNGNGNVNPNPSQSSYSFVYNSNDPNNSHYRTQIYRPQQNQHQSYTPPQSHAQSQPSSAYSHVFNNNQHQTHLNRNDLYHSHQQSQPPNNNVHYGAMPNQNSMFNHNHQPNCNCNFNCNYNYLHNNNNININQPNVNMNMNLNNNNVPRMNMMNGNPSLRFQSPPPPSSLYHCYNSPNVNLCSPSYSHQFQAPQQPQLQPQQQQQLMTNLFSNILSNGMEMGINGNTLSIAMVNAINTVNASCNNQQPQPHPPLVHNVSFYSSTTPSPPPVESEWESPSPIPVFHDSLESGLSYSFSPEMI